MKTSLDARNSGRVRIVRRAWQATLVAFITASPPGSSYAERAIAIEGQPDVGLAVGGVPRLV
jgi:hypothetical protein